MVPVETFISWYYQGLSLIVVCRRPLVLVLVIYWDDSSLSIWIRLCLSLLPLILISSVIVEGILMTLLLRSITFSCKVPFGATVVARDLSFIKPKLSVVVYQNISPPCPVHILLCPSHHTCKVPLDVYQIHVIFIHLGVILLCEMRIPDLSCNQSTVGVDQG